MRLLRRLILSFTVLAFLPLLLMAGMSLAAQRQQLMHAGREHVRCLATGFAQQVDFLLERTIEQVQQLACSHRLAEDLSAVNRRYEGVAEQTIREALLARDREWLAAADPSQTELAGQCLNNQAAAALKAFQGVARDRYAEIMLTDRFGALYAATNVTTDYYQADEEWWQRAHYDGRGDTFVSQIRFDQSAGVYALDVATPVRDQAGNVAGILKVSHAVSTLFHLVRDLKAGQTGGADLVDAQGKAVFAHLDRGEGLRFDSATMETINALAEGVLVGRPVGGQDEQVIGFGVLANTRKGGRAPVAGGPWFALVSQSGAEVYAPTRRALLWSLLVLALPLAGLVLVAAYLNRRLVEPIRALHWASEQVAAGHLDVRVEIGRADEIEQVGYQFNRMTAALQRHEEGQRLEIRRRTEELRQTDMQSRWVRDVMSAEMNSITQGMQKALGEMRRAFEAGINAQANAARATGAWLTVRALVDDLHDLCKMEGGRMALEPEQLSLGDALESARRMVTPLLGQYEVTLDFPPEACGLSLVADRAKLKEILYALLSNAVKYSPKGSAVSVLVSRQEGATVIGVRDQGAGIPTERQARVFDPLTGRAAGPRPPSERIGLSLPVTKQLVELHGGRLWFESRPAAGTTFYFSLPDRQVLAAPTPAEA